MILASRSPRRKELLTRCGVEFCIYDAAVGELTAGSGIPVEELPAANAELKAGCAAEKFPQELVLGADTMVICDGTAYGKPADENESFRMLQSLSGKTHQVITGVALIDRSRNIREVWSEITHVHFKELSDDTIRQYIQQVYTLDKAGAYAIQEHGDLIVDHIDGEIENVIGLPLIRLKQRLQQI
ncbi:MAG: septum formation protein Maf [Lentisphaerae bacterium]|jgi:septum formation protein|nr:septum formation protein Maf [Lentisphaerota bacterium]